mmetsp:Transcript_45226/g.127396  ORF Transcript_45226/g.127396 Transcript_45226/m.127396 type:complete len:205 (-) Transcript_45226:70-684(-)
MTAMACNIELKPRQMKRLRRALSVVTGATASTPMLNSCMVRLPSWSTSISSKITRASSMFVMPALTSTSHHSLMSKSLFESNLESKLMASKASAVVEYFESILRLNSCSGWPVTSCMPFRYPEPCTWELSGFLTFSCWFGDRFEPLTAQASLKALSSSGEACSWAAKMNRIFPPTSRSTFVARAPCTRRMTFLPMFELAMDSRS